MRRDVVSARAWRFIVGGVAVVTACVSAGFLLDEAAPARALVPDQEQAYAMMPAITAFLDSKAY